MHALGSAAIPFWLRGGWALDFFLSEITRAHDDVDLFAWGEDSVRLVEVLVEAGFHELRSATPLAQRNFLKDEEEVHIVLLERTVTGVLQTPGGRWRVVSQSALDVSEPEVWPEGMLASRAGRLGDLVVPIVSPVAQLHAKEVAGMIDGHSLTQKHRDDIHRLRIALGRGD